jgi:hypothetical protein
VGGREIPRRRGPSSGHPRWARLARPSRPVHRRGVALDGALASAPPMRGRVATTTRGRGPPTARRPQLRSGLVRRAQARPCPGGSPWHGGHATNASTDSVSFHRSKSKLPSIPFHPVLSVARYVADTPHRFEEAWSWSISVPSSFLFPPRQGSSNFRSLFLYRSFSPLGLRRRWRRRVISASCNLHGWQSCCRHW